MKFTTIWTLPGMLLVERLRRTRDLALMNIAHHIPRCLAYWSFIDSGVRVIHSNEIVTETNYIELLQRMESWVR